jgi:putative ABC transport system permease protein
MIISTLHKHFIIRQIIHARRQAVVFVVCVALSIVTLIALNGFSAGVHIALLNDARSLHAADVIIRSNHEFPPAITDIVTQLETEGIATGARVYEFYSVVRTRDNGDSLLANIKVVQKGYPFYGQVTVLSQKPFESVLDSGRIVVSQTLLDRLKVKTGDSLHVGQALLTIEDIVLQEPDQPVSFYFLGPRIFIAADDLEEIDLVKKGSRVRYLYLLRVYKEDNIKSVVERLDSVADKDFVTVNSFRTAESGVKRFFDNFLFFLGLIGIFTLLLAGFGIQSTMSAFLKEKEKTIAIMKTMGADSSFFMRHFIVILALLGLSGTALGLILGVALQHVLHALFTGLLPPNVKPVVSFMALLEGVGLGVLVVGLFCFMPLHRLKEVKPLIILQKASFRTPKNLMYILTAGLIFLFFVGMVLWRLSDLRTGFYFIVGVLAIILISALAAEVALFGLKRVKFKSLVLRQALKGLFRPRNATKPIIITLTASLAVIFSIYLVEQNLDATYIRSYPPDAPNLFFVDIQPAQLDSFSQTLGLKSEYYPIVRAKITAVDGDRINRKKERRRRGDNLGRTFNLTYRNYLLEDERIIKGQGMFRPDWGNMQVSVLDTVTEIKKMRIGDTIAFNIHGIPLEAKISSIRTRTRESLRPFFYFVFPENTLKDAPQAIFTAVRVSGDRSAALQARMAAKFPTVSAIDVSQTLSSFGRVLKKLSLIIRFFTFFSITAGILIILSSTLATRYARIQEAVYYKILGARSNFVLKVFTLENLLVGLISSALALLLSQAESWLICTFILDISYAPFLFESLLMVLGTLTLVLTVGVLPSIGILRQKPVKFLREQTQE